MDLIIWSDKYSVANSLIDSQHKKLVSLINELHSAMVSGKGKDILQKILSDLVKYTKEHFSAEEAMMQKAKYAGFVEHKIIHDKLTAKVVELQKSFSEGKALLTLEVMKFLKDWLTNHIEGTDKKYKGKI